MSETATSDERPPAPPRFAPRLRLPRTQWLGLLLFAVPPVLALGGVFDARRAHVVRHAGPLEVHVEYPERVRANRTARVEVELVHRGERPVRATVAIAPSYLRDAVAIDMAPPPTRAWATDVGPLAPGARERVALDFEADGAGRYEGTLRVREEGGAEARVELSTFVFP